MKKRFLASLLLLTLLLVGCTETVADHSSAEPDTQSSAVSSAEVLSAEESSEKDSSTPEEQSLLQFNYNNPPFASYADYTEFIKQADGKAMVISTNYDPVTSDCDWQYAATDLQQIEKSLQSFSHADSCPIYDVFISHWIVLPNGYIFGCFPPEASMLAQINEHDTRLFGVRCYFGNNPDHPLIEFSYGYLSSDLYPNILDALGLLDEEVEPKDTEDLFTWVPHKPPFAHSADYLELQKRADGKAVVVSWSLDDELNDVWNYKFVEMQDGPQALKDGEDTIILQNTPYLKNIWFYEFIIFPDGTVYGTYTPSVSERVAKVCEVDTDRDYGTIFSVDASGYKLAVEETQCFLPEGVFDLLERELGEIEAEGEGYIFEVPEELLADDPTGMPFDSLENAVKIMYGKNAVLEDIDHPAIASRFACFERVTEEDGTMHWATVYRWPGQDPIWQIDELFTPTDKNYYGDDYNLFLIDTPDAEYDRSDGSPISFRMYAMFAESSHDEVIDGYESHAGKPYGAIYTFDMTADELTYTVEYGYFEKNIAGFIDVAE